jgi:4-amino-4-deoxy-L-arabinose transferase-like glycosyltransferase
MRPQPFKRISELLNPTRLSASSFHTALIFLWAILTLFSLGAAPLFDYDETAHAQAAVEMLRDGKWLLPTMNGQSFYEKPAFLFYFMSTSFTLFGENAFAARLPSVLFTLATALYLYYLGRRIGRPIVGSTASLIYLSMLMPALLAHAAILDATLNFWIAVSVLSFFLWRQSGRLRDAILSMLAAGIAVSVKGPVGAVLPFFVIIIDRLAGKDFTNNLHIFPWKWGIPAFFVGALPWYVLVSVVYGFGFLREFILVENFHRFTHSMEGHSGGWYYYLIILIPSTLPWVAWLPWWLKQAITRWTELEELGQISRMSIIWTIVVIMLFSISQTKLPHYISSIYPAMALGISAQWYRQEPERSWIRSATLILLIVCIPLALSLLALPNLYSYIAGMVKHPHAVAILTQDIRPGFWIPAAGAILFASLLVLLWQTRHSPSSTTLTRFILFGFLLQTSLVWSIAPWAGRLMQAQLLNIAATIRTFPPAIRVYSVVNCPSVSFYSGRSYSEVKAGDLEQLASSSTPYLLVARTKSLADISFLPLEVVVRDKDFVLLRNAHAHSVDHLHIPINFGRQF